MYGAVDPLEAVADVCSAHSLWMHVDVRQQTHTQLPGSTRERSHTQLQYKQPNQTHNATSEFTPPVGIWRTAAVFNYKSHQSDWEELNSAVLLSGARGWHKGQGWTSDQPA